MLYNVIHGGNYIQTADPCCPPTGIGIEIMEAVDNGEPCEVLQDPDTGTVFHMGQLLRHQERGLGVVEILNKGSDKLGVRFASGGYHEYNSSNMAKKLRRLPFPPDSFVYTVKNGYGIVAESNERCVDVIFEVDHVFDENLSVEERDQETAQRKPEAER